MLERSPVTLKTSRLRLRPLQMNDAAEISRLAGQREIADTTISIPHPYPVYWVEEWIRSISADIDAQQAAHWAIDFARTGELAGAIGLRDIDTEHSLAEITFWIAVQWWGKGIGTEATHAVLKYAFEALQLNRIYAYHMVRNPASGRLLEKCGFRQEGILRQRVRKWGVYEDVIIRAILQKDWQV